jgi:hypothetical protein
MKLTIQRVWETPLAVCGELTVDGQWECYTLEPSRTDPVYPGHPCIPAGTYPVILTFSPHLGYITPELVNVPGRTAIRLHIGNFPKDVKGCTAVGAIHTTNFVGESHEAFSQLMTLLRTATDSVTATYIDPVTQPIV